MAESRIVISVDQEGREDISIENFNVNYLPYVLGRLVNSVIDNKNVTGPVSDAKKKELRETAAAVFCEELGVLNKNVWIPVKAKKPDKEGPFFCKEDGRPIVYTDMYYDRQNNMFGTREGTGYSFITHWCPYPEGTYEG